MVHLDPKAGEIHTDEPGKDGSEGPHPVREWLTSRIRCPLFLLGDFTLRSGAKSDWKIECDAFTDEDWKGLARIAAQMLPAFGRVRGVPRGGIPFAVALREYATNNREDPVLIAEDVCTTGGSMERFLAELIVEGVFHGLHPSRGYDVIGVSVFARNPEWPAWVYPLFPLNHRTLKAHK